MMWQAVGALAAFDRFAQTVTLVRNVLVGDDPAGQYAAAVADLGRDAARLGTPHSYRVSSVERPALPDVVSTMERSEFEDAVREAKERILRGDAFQVVLSQRLTASTEADPFGVYRALRIVNPSPYLFFLLLPIFCRGVVGRNDDQVRDGLQFLAY